MTNLRFVTASSLFDGHDAAINIMRRLLQSQGVEVIHLGHNRSAWEVVLAAIQEDVHAIAISSYQGGHNEYFAYIRELLDEHGAQKVKIFGGGGGVITPKEIEALESKGIDKIYSPEDGMKLGLEGIIKDMIKKSTYSTTDDVDFKSYKKKNLSVYEIAKVISSIENSGKTPYDVTAKNIPVLGITGTGGAGKSSLIDELLLRFHDSYSDKKIALISVDPTKKRTKGALLGDRIRLGSAAHDQFFVRSLATRDSKTELSPQIEKVINFIKSLDFDLIMVETSGIGQASDEITRISDKSIYVMTPEYGAQTQLEKIEMIEMADVIVINKFEKPKGEDAFRDVRKQYRRNRNDFDSADEDLPIYGTIASQFNDTGVNGLFYKIIKLFDFDTKAIEKISKDKASKVRALIIPKDRALYLSEVAKANRDYNKNAFITAEKLYDYQCLEKSNELIKNNSELSKKLGELRGQIGEDVFSEIETLDKIVSEYKEGTYKHKIKEKEIESKTKYTTLANLNVSKVGLPKITSLSERYLFYKLQNIPGHFPFVSGLFPFKRQDEDPKRQFAGEGGPSRTNQRFHYLSSNDSAKRLSTAFDSVTLYGENPDKRPDIYGKIGESGVSICTLDDMEDLFRGFDLIGVNTSVSMTINGPAPIILAMFMNAALKQNLKESELSDEKKCLEILQQVRGTVQADILKEDQAQNTCIFSLDFALKMMGDVQEFFSNNKIRNYYTVSISGYHIAEAGANPISQLAFTLTNGFTYVEYYLSRGIPVDSFCENLSFFFSNGLDAEYTVIGRVARKIWAVAMRDKYGANIKSQKLKYHIQTSGRSLHAQEVDFNDIRTTLQAFLALSDSCNSLHTNAFDEAITTPTQESVRRAMAIQMIINKEFGLNKTDNPLQGSFIFDELADLVEEVVLKEFDRISERGGVLGAMENMYQRSKIQEESLYYERKKDSGEIPIIGVNTYIAENIDEQLEKEVELTRASTTEKDEQIKRLEGFHKRNEKKSSEALIKLKDTALNNGNIFKELLTTVRYCSLGQITNVLYGVGGKYRRNM